MDTMLDIENLLQRALDFDGTNGELAGAIIHAVSTMIEIANHTKCNWTQARADATCMQLKHAIDIVCEKINARTQNTGTKNG